jgi:CRISPR system Cascade subunit CasD
VNEFLLFTLYAPLASWGEIAVGESRGSWARPSRSAMLGLMAAALGIERDDQARHGELDEDCALAVRLDAPGSPLVDYHTAQTVAASVVKKRRPATRAELLNAVAAGDRETILSRRTYRQDSLATVALWIRSLSAAWTLAELQDALRRPRFVLYAGRKANAFGLPLAPEIVSAPTLGDALLRYAEQRYHLTGIPADARREVQSTFDRLASRRASARPGGWGREVSHDPCIGFDSGLEPQRRETRRDASPHRGRWQFAERVVEVGLLPASELARPTARESWETDI